MAGSPTQAANPVSQPRTEAQSPERTVLVFDGDCGFCTTAAHWIQTRIPETIAVQPSQRLDLAASGLTQDDVTTAVWLVRFDSGGSPVERHRGHVAIAEVLQLSTSRLLGGAGRLLGLRVVAPIGRLGYSLVARNRHRLPGSTDACKL